jgi:hypothetical protein
MAPDLAGKRLELATELVPETSRVAVLWNAANPLFRACLQGDCRRGQDLGHRSSSLEVRAPTDFDAALATATAQQVGALITVEDPLTGEQARKIAKFAVDNDCQRYRGSGCLQMPVGSYPMMRTLAICCVGAWSTWTKFSKARNHPTCPSSSRPRSSWSSISRPPKRSASPFLRVYWNSRTRSLSEQARGCPGADSFGQAPRSTMLASGQTGTPRRLICCPWSR